MGYPETYWCQIHNFGLARVAIVCALVWCKFISDEPRSAIASAGYFKKRQILIWNLERVRKITVIFRFKRKMLKEAAQLRGWQSQIVNITKSLILTLLLPSLLPSKMRILFKNKHRFLIALQTYYCGYLYIGFCTNSLLKNPPNQKYQPPLKNPNQTNQTQNSLNWNPKTNNPPKKHPHNKPTNPIQIPRNFNCLIRMRSVPFF